MSRVVAKTIAQYCGVSVSTVLDILGKYGHRYNEATRKKVLEAAKKFNYRPSAAARMMVKGRTYTLGVLAKGRPSTGIDIASALLSGIESMASELGFNLLLARIPTTPEEGKNPRTLFEDTLEGVLLLNEYCDEEINTFFPNLPIVAVNVKGQEKVVYPDDYGAARKLTELIRDRSIFRFIYIGRREGPTSHFSVRDRRLGCMETEGIQCELWDLPSDLQRYEWIEWIREKIQSFEPPLGVVTYGADLAASVALAIQSFPHLVLGQNVWIGTFANYGDGAYEIWPILIAYVPQWEMGRAAVEMLVKWIENSQEVPPAQVVKYNFSSQVCYYPPEWGDGWSKRK